MRGRRGLAAALVRCEVCGTLTETEETAMLNEIVKVLSDGDRIQIEVGRTAKGVRLTVTPLLADDAEKVPEEAQGTRAALALPLVVTGATAEEVESALAERYAGYAAARGELQHSYRSLLDTLREASKEASGKALAKGAGQAKASGAKPPAASAPGAVAGEQSAGAEVAASAPAPSEAGDVLALTFD